MRKILLLDDYFPTGEQTVQPVLLWGPGRRQQDLRHITKTASDALDYIKDVTPEPGKTHLLLLALGSEEAYGPNRNGDGFPERPVPARHKTTGADSKRWYVAPGEELTKHYQSFETNPAHAFKHHQNRDPEKASGHVKKAFWNNKMHRVELLIVIDNAKDPEWVQRVNDGDFPPVSMGCFTAGTLVTMADGTRRNIEDVKVGDMVRTHTGRARRVTEVHVRDYKGAIHAIHAEAHETLRCTAEHPFHTVNRQDVKKKNRKAAFRWDPAADPTTDWVHAECLDDDEHLLLEPIDREVCTPDYVTRAFARLFGYYLAEGHVLRNRDKEIFAIELTTHKDDAVHGEIEELCAAFGTRLPPCTTPRRNCDDARSILISDARLARLCYEHGGGYAQQKRFSISAMHWNPEMQREVLGAYANGDGCEPYAGSLRLSTSSTNLAWQWISILPRLNICASICNLTHKAGSDFSTRTTYEWVIHIGKQWAQTLRDVCAKITPVEILAVKNSRRIIGDVIVTPIRNHDALYAEMKVYNLEVDEDNSFVAGGLAVHNCRIKKDVCSQCGNEAPTRAQYCDHVKFMMGHVNADGSKNYVHNPSPNFFDISRVFRPADKIGYTLKKVAMVPEVFSSAELGDMADAVERKSAAIKKVSDIDKIIRGEPVASSSNLSPKAQLLIKNFRDYTAKTLTETPDFPMEELRKHSAAQVFTALTSLGMMFKDAEFIEFMGAKMTGNALRVPRELALKTAALLPNVFTLFEASPALCDEIMSSGALDGTREKVSNALQELLTPYREKRAAVGELLYRRLLPEGTGLRSDAQPTTDVLTYTDPRSRNTYQTTRGAALDMQDARTKSNVGNVLGGSALLLGGYKLLSAIPSLRPLALPLTAGAGYLGHKALKRSQENVITNEGISIPYQTEFAPSTKLGAESITPIVVNFIEAYARNAPSDTVKQGAELLRTLKNTATIDSVRGLELNSEQVATALGDLATC